MLNLKKRGRFVVLAAGAVLLAAACGTSEPEAGGSGGEGGGDAGLSGTIQIDGSSTVAPLSTAAAELFEAENPGVSVVVGTSGTGGGFEAFCAGETDISDASRVIADDEIAACEEAGIAFEEIPVANDGLSVVVNPENDWADCLTVEQLNAIWEPDSTVNNWNQVDPSFPDVPLDLFGPGTDSGTFDYFTEAINGEEGASRTDYNPSEDDNVTIQGVQGSPGAMGYFGLSYAEENADTVKLLGVDNGEGCVEPSTETVLDGSYAPLGRQLFVYPSDQALERPEVVAFMEFYLQNQADIAEQALFVPLSEEQAAESQALVAELAGS